MDPEIATLHHRLSHQAQTLLTELDAFKNHIQSHPHSHNITKFRADVARETKQLEHNGSKLQASHTSVNTSTTTTTHPLPAGTTIHQIRSSNITHLSSIWHEVKRNKGVIGIRKQVRYTVTFNPSLPPFPLAPTSTSVSTSPTPNPSSSKHNHSARQRSKIYHARHAAAQRTGTGSNSFQIPRSDKEVVTVDVVADHGAKWVKVFTKSLRWVAMDLAREGLVELDLSRGEEVEGDREGDAEREGGWGREDDGVNSEGDADGNVDGNVDINGNSKSVRRQNLEPGLEAGLDLDLEELKLVKMAREFLTAARTTRVGLRHRHPTVYFILAKIARGVSADVDAVLRYIEDIGVMVTTAPAIAPAPASAEQRVVDGRDHRAEDIDADTHPDQPTASTPELDLDLTLTFTRILTPAPLSPPSQTLNIDTTLLIALISDISHLSPPTITVPTHYNGRASKADILAQMASEDKDPLLPRHIYPVLRGRRLVCTRAAERHLRGIVGVMGSVREAARSCVLLGGGGDPDGDGDDERDAAGVRREFGRDSVHEMPDDLMLPIEVVEDDKEDSMLVKRPSPLDAEVMRRMADQPRLSALNRSVFYHGWREGLTTVSLNRVVSEWLERAVDGILDEIEVENGCAEDVAVEGGFVGPRVLVCGRERSLLGNEKRGNHSRADGAG